MKIEILGAYGGKDKNKFTTCFLINNSLLIDAGNIFANNITDLSSIDNILLTHSHFDHINDLPYLIDFLFPTLKKPINIYASQKTIENLKNFIFNSVIWPNFHEISLINKNYQALNFIPLEPNKEIKIKNHTILPFKVNHTIDTFGYLVNNELLISGDTYYSEEILKIINTYKPNTIFLECSFPDKLNELAKISKHLTPNIIKKIISQINYNPKIYLYHLKPQFIEDIKKEIDLPILEDNNILDTNTNQILNNDNDYQIFKMIKEITTQNNIDYILENIVNLTKKITNADGISLYLKEDNYLKFKIIKNDTLKINKKDDVNWPKIPLYIDGKRNEKMVVALSVLNNEIINIDDVYYDKNFNFEGTKKFDKSTGYRSKSMLVIPLQNHEKEVIGALQLINKLDKNKNIIPFDKNDEEKISVLASIAAISLTKNKLIEDFEKLFESFIKTIGLAIDKKSKHTGDHVRKVAKLAQLIAHAIQNQGIKQYSPEELKTIEISGWLHDIGKITTPEFVIDKATKLQKTIDRIELIKYRFEILQKELEIKFLKKEISKEDYEKKSQELKENFDFIKKLNNGEYFVTEEDIKKLKKIAQQKVLNENLLTEDEVKNLSIKRGTLNEEERKIIEAHAKNGIEMLKSIHYPKKYINIPKIAGNHHEKLNCKGYPNHLCAKDLSLEERLMTIADIFEALSSKDRPYKTPKKLSEIFKILYFMAKDNEIDKNIVKAMIKENVHLKYAKEELMPDQIDEIPEEILNFFLKDEN